MSEHAFTWLARTYRDPETEEWVYEPTDNPGSRARWNEEFPERVVALCVPGVPTGSTYKLRSVSTNGDGDVNGLAVDWREGFTEPWMVLSGEEARRHCKAFIEMGAMWERTL